MTSRSAVLAVRGWPEADCRRYRELGLWTEETFADFVTDRTTRFAARQALVGRDAHGRQVRWTYRELGEQAEAMARRLLAAGVRPGDRVVVTLPNIVEYVTTVLGLFRLGALPVFGLPGHRERELTQFCTIADAAAVVICADVDGYDHVALLDRVADRLRAGGHLPPVVIDVRDDTSAGDAPVPTPALHAEQVAFLQLSGGTTGIAKLIPRTAADYLYSVRASAGICELDADTVMLVVLPASHNFPMSSPGILGALHVGAKVVLAWDASPRTAFSLVAAERATTVALVPPLAQAWISAARRRTPDLSSLQMVQVGGARLNDVIARQITPVLGARLQQVFGMAEGLVCYTRGDDPEDLVIGSQGRPISALDEIRIVDEHDVDVPEGQEGSLLTRGPYTIRSYYGDTPANTDAFTADGYYRTGDLVRRLPSGHLVVTGRDKDQINRGGEKIACAELEGLLLSHPAVLDAAVIGLPDRLLGERVCAVLRIQTGAERPDDLARYLREAGLATHKIPDSFEFLDTFPATHVGKNSRRDLRALLSAQLQAATSPAPPQIQE